MSTNITPAIIEAFEALRNPEYSNFALVSCFVNGEPATAIALLDMHDNGDSTEAKIMPLFVSLTPSMMVVDHDGVVANY